MRQLTQDLKKGRMRIIEVPYPVLGKGQLLVKNHYSVISAGTERKTVSDARKGYLAKAKARKKDVKQVIDMAKTAGIKNTYKTVMSKLEALSQLGYSCAGEVVEVGEGVSGFRVGDHVACGGSSAVHAEVVAVPKNLCVKVPGDVDLDKAAFATIAAIALQGIRQADLKLGEHCAVIGLGLVGQMTLYLLQAAGVRSIGIDVDPLQVIAADKNSADLVINRSRKDLEKVVLDATRGIGTDAVIITASSTSTDPVDLAGTLCRRKGKVVIVGVVPTGFERSHYYKKELDLRMSCSYGPGRYDPEYEEKGRDYPVGYVRWSENRNMQAYIDLLAKKRINIQGVITHVFEFNEAPKAYQMILDRAEPFTGILLKYETDKEPIKRVILQDKPPLASEPAIGLIGAGKFAQNKLLPNMKELGQFIGVATARGNNARFVADKYGFNYASGNAGEILDDKDINSVVIATRHNLHAVYVVEALKKGKHVFVEKPMAMSNSELENIHKVYKSSRSQEHPPLLMVGFNRRFAPHIQMLKSEFDNDLPVAIHMRINAGELPEDHWIHDPEQGGGRIIGEACHFIDLAMFIAGSKIHSVSSYSLGDTSQLNDTLFISLSFENGSIAGISYFSNGSKKLQKEYMEVFCSGRVAAVDDFKTMTMYDTSMKKTSLSSQDKGHKNELCQFFKSVREGKESPIPFDELYMSTLATLKVQESLEKGQQIYL